MMPWEMYMGILWVHKTWGPEIMALWLQDMYVQLCPKEAKLLIREQELDSRERLQVLINKNVDDLQYPEENRWQEC